MNDQRINRQIIQPFKVALYRIDDFFMRALHRPHKKCAFVLFILKNHLRHGNTRKTLKHSTCLEGLFTPLRVKAVPA
jgi:hypothetical protein